MERFILVDGHAMLHRAYHALPPLTSKDGEVVNAVYGFFSMMLKILGDLHPEYLAVCFDRPAPTFRKQLYVGYQATRPQMADNLGPQISLVHDMLEGIGVAVYEMDGYEADDLIGTIATQAVEKDDGRKLKVEDSNKKIENGRSSNIDVIIVTGDRDMLQLVNGHVRVLAPVVGVTQMTLYNEEKVIEKYGLKPKQFVDYKALIGDASDNYPGVAGIGPKTAAHLLNTYETFENIYHHLGDISPKIAEKLATDAEQAALAKKLATIVTDAPVSFDIEKCQIKNVHMEKLEKSFEELGFNSLLKRFFETSDKGKEISDKKKEKPADHIKQLGLL